MATEYEQDELSRKEFQEGPNRHYCDLYVQLKRNIAIKTKILGQEQNVCELAFAPPSSAFSSSSSSSDQHKEENLNTKTEEEKQEDENEKEKTVALTEHTFCKHREQLVQILSKEFQTSHEMHKQVMSQHFPHDFVFEHDHLNQTNKEEEQVEKKKQNNETKEPSLLILPSEVSFDEARKEVEDLEQKIIDEIRKEIDEKKPEEEKYRKMQQQQQQRQLVKKEKEKGGGDQEDDYDEEEQENRIRKAFPADLISKSTQELVKQRFLRVNKMLQDVTEKQLEERRLQ